MNSNCTHRTSEQPQPDISAMDVVEVMQEALEVSLQHEIIVFPAPGGDEEWVGKFEVALGPATFFETVENAIYSLEGVFPALTFEPGNHESYEMVNVWVTFPSNCKACLAEYLVVISHDTMEAANTLTRADRARLNMTRHA